MLSTKSFVVFTLLSFNLSWVNAAMVTQINRYATVENKPLPAQVNPLLAVQQMHFPNTVKTVGDAMQYWLRYSGFSLAPIDKQPEALIKVMNLPLPQVDRHLGPLTVLDGLEVLAGQNLFSLKNDTFHREVRFTVKPGLLTPPKHNRSK